MTRKDSLTDPFYPIGPFRAWLELFVSRQDPRGPRNAAAAKLGLPPRQLREYLDSPRTKVVRESTIDKALCTANGPHIANLYPGEYPL